MIVLIGKLTYVGTTSMEVRVDTYVEHLSDGMRYPINRAYFTMVGLDEKDKPCRIPRLTIKSEEEKAEWEAAEKRREMRMHRRKEGFEKRIVEVIRSEATKIIKSDSSGH